MSNFHTYERVNNPGQEIKIRSLTEDELNGTFALNVKLNQQDLKNGSPKKGDMIAKNPENEHDLALINKRYFEQNFKRVN